MPHDRVRGSLQHYVLSCSLLERTLGCSGDLQPSHLSLDTWRFIPPVPALHRLRHQLHRRRLRHARRPDPQRFPERSLRLALLLQAGARAGSLHSPLPLPFPLTSSLTCRGHPPTPRRGRRHRQARITATRQAHITSIHHVLVTTTRQAHITVARRLRPGRAVLAARALQPAA